MGGVTHKVRRARVSPSQYLRKRISHRGDCPRCISATLHATQHEQTGDGLSCVIFETERGTKDSAH
jgi:hypothetical protein